MNIACKLCLSGITQVNPRRLYSRREAHGVVELGSSLCCLPSPPSAVAATCSVYSLSPYTHMSICLVFTWKESALRLPYQIRRPIPHRTPFMPPTRKVSDAAASIIQPLFSCSRATCYRSNSPGHCRPGPNPRSLRGGRVMQNLPPDGHGF